MAVFAVCCFLLLLSSAIAAPSEYDSKSTCGYQSCNPVKEGMVNVHLVPHTHDDVGWLKTVDQYYYGAETRIQNAGVQYILDSVIPELLKDPSRRFIYVEMAFFWRWWHEQHDHMRHVVKKLVNEGRLEFILGGWCMNDEATTHYSAIIDQHTLGFDFLSKTFGACGRPRVAWQIDPFGHSKEMASLFAGMGFDGLFFGRADYQDIVKRVIDRNMEMMWKANQNIGDQANLFTGILLNGYNPPPGFCFDELCSDDPIMDDKRLREYNLDVKLAMFTTWVGLKSLSLRTNHIILTMGSDFQYSNANAWYKNLDKLIYYINARQSNGSKLNLLYSTPSCYLNQLNKAGITWPEKTDDFFPYADRPHSFWTGYFTSRPAIKQYAREASGFFQVCRHFDVFAKLYNHIKLFELWESLSVAQHHDAISGTEKQAVADDYVSRLSVGTQSCQVLVNSAYQKLLPKGKVSPPTQFFCSLLNISMCNVTENLKQFTMTVYNPMARGVSHWVQLPVAGKGYVVYGPNTKPIETQIVPIDMATKRIPERKRSLAQNLLVFPVQILPLGFATYFVKMTENDAIKENSISEISVVEQGQDFELNNGIVSVSFSGVTGHMKVIHNLKSKVSISLKQDYMYYIGHTGNNKKPNEQASNNYIFRPLNNTPTSVGNLRPVKSVLVKGKLVQEVHQVFCPWITQIVRLYRGANHAEVDWTVGSIPIKDKQGKEVIVSYQSDLKTNSLFYTDANGRQILERKLNYRPTWPLEQTEPVAGNYYPVNTKIFIKDAKRDVQFTVLTDRSQGGSSMEDGNLQLMLHRRLLYDDGKGVGEPLNETGVDGKGLIIRGRHYLYVDTKESSTVFHRKLAVETFMKPTLSFSELETTPQVWTSKFHTQWSAMKSGLPGNVNLLTLQQWTGRKLLLRLEHVFEKNEGSLSKPVTISLKNLFVPFNITAVEELVLGANLKLSDLHRLKWKSEGNTTTTGSYFQRQEALDVTLSPMDIKTFAVTVA